jgi:hypothetical protein
MSTRSVIAKPYGDIWKGRYCHWDGYPQWLGHNLFNIVKRDGVEVARKTLVDDNFYWSSIKYGADEVQYEGDTRFYLVQGYGTAGNEEQSSPDEWYTPMDLDSWIEYVYVITDDGLMVLSDATTLFGFYPWDLPEPDWSEEVKAFDSKNQEELV